jgi:hypothetical protein
MALKEQDIVFTTTDEAGNPVIQFPITRVENVEDAVRTVNKKKPDSNGDIQIDVDMSHLATKDELTKGLANKRDHTIQIANADLNTLLEDKTWACSGTLKNTPIACTFCIVQAYDTGAPVSGNIVQVCYVPNLTDNTVRTFWRNCNNGVTFGKWSESGAVKTVNSIAPDASGEVTLPNATTSKAGLVRLAAEEDVLNEAPQTAVCTQLIYEINEFRRKSTAYQVGDKVDCAFQYERFLECTKAGKTSAELLDTRNVTHGQVIADGMVEWTVRTHVRSVNGNVAGADGNVLVDVGAKTVNGNTPDSNGNVSVDVGAKTVEGKAPDSKGNVYLGLHAVATSGNYNDLSNKPNIPPATRMMPNYGSFVQITKGDFTPVEDGWLRLENMNSGDYTGGKVIHKASGAKLFEFYQNRYPGTATGILPVRAGETYTVSNVGKVYFHPMR